MTDEKWSSGEEPAAAGAGFGPAGPAEAASGGEGAPGSDAGTGLRSPEQPVAGGGMPAPEQGSTGAVTRPSPRAEGASVLEADSEGDEDAPAPSGAKGERGATLRIVNRDVEDPAAAPELQEMVGMYLDSLKHLEEGEVLKGRVLRVDEKDVLVDIGFKSEGIIPIAEFAESDSIKVGDEIDVFLERIEDDQGLVVLSKQRADFVKVWDRVKDAAERGEVVEGRLVKKIKGGVVVDLFGVEAFLPGSQIALRQPQSIDSLMTQTLRFKIIKLNKRRRNIVVSRRLVLEEEREKAKASILQELGVGQVRGGYVKNITDFGAFIDLGGIDGLLHITDMSWGRIRHPSEVVSVGDKLQVKVLSFDPERERISLGIKQLSDYPWEHVADRYPVGSRISGRVVSITEYGAFVELEKGVEGLIHISEMSWTKHVRHPSKILKEGQEVECMVLKVDKEKERISLGLKQVEPDPWLTLDERYPVNSIVSGKVRNLTNFGSFVELEDGIDGLVHISDMSWTRRIGHPSELLKKGDSVTVRVLSLDKVNRRVSLGLKQVQDDPWPKLMDTYPANATVRGTIAKVIDRGAVVILEQDVEGFVPTGQLGLDDVTDARRCFREGDALDMKITRVDPANRRILLSVKAWLAEQDEQVVRDFVEMHKAREAESGPLPEASEEGAKGIDLPEDEAPAGDAETGAAPAGMEDAPAARAKVPEGPAEEAAAGPRPAEAAVAEPDEPAASSEADMTAGGSEQAASSTEPPEADRPTA
ncbi:MAG: 30S ribosomal protein S1 [Candidatus Eisenbacteria bacterium]|uniref:Small ribosomal subunit protein bS1 n=1 Tax=Eiseniibacteriota bacterium TaxID=2212470 RepID=A0A938BPV5_UNCEI|nr:30S ribosomal protein S1 [Candidatus Eisenbacteria bacterium]